MSKKAGVLLPLQLVLERNSVSCSTLQLALSLLSQPDEWQGTFLTSHSLSLLIFAFSVLEMRRRELGGGQVEGDNSWILPFGSKGTEIKGVCALPRALRYGGGFVTGLGRMGPRPPGERGRQARGLAHSLEHSPRPHPTIPLSWKLPCYLRPPRGRTSPGISLIPRAVLGRIARYFSND